MSLQCTKHLLITLPLGSVFSFFFQTPLFNSFRTFCQTSLCLFFFVAEFLYHQKKGKVKVTLRENLIFSYSDDAILSLWTFKSYAIFVKQQDIFNVYFKASIIK